MNLNLPNAQIPLVTKSGNISQVWLLFINALTRQQLTTYNTAGGSVTVALPAASINLNAELIFKKTSADANTVTVTGAQDGSQVLSAQYQKVRFKSDGTNWWVC